MINFAKISSQVSDFNNRIEILSSKLLKQPYRYLKLRKIVSKFYWLHYEQMFKYNIGLKILLQEGPSELENNGKI